MGPTATGKTDAAAQLSDHFDAEIVSVDSSLVYQGMNIGTAKPDQKFLAEYPHHLVDIRHPNQAYSVADFYQDACDVISDITQRGKLPVLAGGTMFYFQALEQGLANLPQADHQLREKITEEARQKGWPSLHVKLATLDEDRAKSIDPNDAQRIQRALEVVLQSGKSMSELNQHRKPALANPLIKICLSFSQRSKLHARIEQRFDIMLNNGLQKEVEDLLESGVSPESASMKMIGYRQMLEFLKDGTTYQTMRDKGVAATRQLAKRQLTWLRNQSNVLWWVDEGLESKNFDKLIQYVTHSVQHSSYN